MTLASTAHSHFSEDVTWDSLKRAIAASSGFQRWQAEQAPARQEVELEQLVSSYLRETLETLAY